MPPKTSNLEAEYAFQLRAAGIEGWQTEYVFHPGRKWRFDFCFPAIKLAVEIEGGVYLKNKGGHVTGKGYTNNVEKYNQAVLDNWKLLRFTGAHVHSGYALEMTQLALEQLTAPV